MKIKLVCILCGFIFFSHLVYSEDSSLLAVAPESVTSYARSARDGIVITSKDRWYYEELDSLGRPKAGTLWEKGEIIERKSWLYYGDTQKAEKFVLTNFAGSRETGYDTEGNVISLVVMDLKGEIISTLTNTYTEKNNLSGCILTKDGKVKRTELTYDTLNKLRGKKVFINNLIVIEYIFQNEDNWIETIYNNGKSILVSHYENGIRKKGLNEK